MRIEYLKAEKKVNHSHLGCDAMLSIRLLIIFERNLLLARGGGSTLLQNTGNHLQNCHNPHFNLNTQK